MNYELKIDLMGGEKAEAMLSKLKAMSGSLASGGSVLGGGGATTGAGSPLGKQAEDIERLVRQVNAGKVGVHALGKELKNLGQGGGGNMGKLSDMPEALRNKIFAQHPEMKKEWEDRLRQASLGTIKGLREITGKDLAKIQALPSINSYNKPPILPEKEGFLKSLGLSRFATIAGASTLALLAFRKVVSEMSATIERANQIYSKALTSGMGTQFTVKRSLLASIMGVSEQDVFRFGAQMAYLNPRLEQATKILSQTSMPLTKLSWELKILQTDFNALWAKMTTDVAPALTAVARGLDEILKVAAKYGFGALSGAAEGASKVAFGSMLTWAAKLGIKLYGASTDQKLPGPQSWMKQLPASHWERMGLVTMGGSQNYAKDTARNTKEMAVALRALAAHMIKGGKTGSWGMSPQASQP